MHPTLTILVHAAAAAALSLGGIVGQSPALETRLLALAAGSNLPATVSAFRALEQAAPPPADLLRSSPERLDGRWSLVATVAATVGEDLAESVDSGTARASAVNASGVVVDASEGTLPVQEVDVKRRRIGNEVSLASPPSLCLPVTHTAFMPWMVCSGRPRHPARPRARPRRRRLSRAPLLETSPRSVPERLP